MKVVVTGGSGLLGQQVISELGVAGHAVHNLDRTPHPAGFRPTWIADLRSEGGLYQAMAGADAVIHLAAHIAPGLAPDTATFNDNVALTYNVFKAAADLGVARVVFASSIGAYGYLYGPLGAAPDYLPIDEAHRCVPTDPYGLSKVVGETIADAFCRDGRMTAASLRFPGINYDPSFKRIAGFMADPGHRQRGFWSYVDVRDAARCCLLAIEAPLAGHQMFNAAAPGSNMREATVRLATRFFPGLEDLRGNATDNWSGIDSAKAGRLLGFIAEHTWERYLRDAELPSPSGRGSGVLPSPSVRGSDVLPSPSGRGSDVLPSPPARGSEVSPSPPARGSEVSPSPSVRGSEVSPSPSVRGSDVLPSPSVRGSDVLPSPSGRGTEGEGK